MIEYLIKKQIKYSKILFIFFVFIIGFAAYYATGIEIETDFNKMVPPTTNFNTNDRMLSNSFESNGVMVVFIRGSKDTILSNAVTDMRDERVTLYIEELRETLEQGQYVVSTQEPRYSEDGRNVLVTANLFIPKSTGGLLNTKNEVENLVSQVGPPPGIEATITGFPVILDLVAGLLINDNLKTILITIIVIFLVLYWYSKDAIFSLITLAVPVISVILLGAFMVYFGIDISITLAAIGVLMLGLGADYSIHIATHYRKARRDHENHTLALIHTIQDLKVPILASFITTLAGFTALMLGISPSSQDQGKVLALGITIVFFVSFLVFPVLLTIFRNKIHVDSNASFRKIISFISKIAVHQSNRPKTVILIIGIITLVMIYGASQVQISTSNSNWIPADNPTSKAFREMNSAYGNSESITLVLTSQIGDLRDVQVARDVNSLVHLLEGIPNVDYVISPYSGISYDSSEVYNKITFNESVRSEFNYDYTLTTITVVSENLGDDGQGNSIVLSNIEEVVSKQPVHNTKVGLYGDSVRFAELGPMIEKDAGLTTMISLVLVFTVATLIYASISIGLIAFVPIIIAVIWAVGFMGFFNVPFTTLSTSIISLVLGIGIDFSIHLVDSIKKFVKSMNLQRAIEETLSTSGAAILLSSITTFTGFSALLFAQLLGTQRLGLALAFSILAVMLVSLTLVPALLSLTLRKHV